MTYEIEKDIPLPPRKSRVSAYPFAEMNVGDSFVVPPTENAPALTTLRNAAAQAKKKLGFKFVVAETYDGIRVWRTE